MAKAKTGVVGLWACLAVAACWGCGDGTPSVSSSKEEASVTGTVKVRGKTATGGEIHFDPSNVNRRDAGISTAPIGKDGSYSIKTLVGENAVRVRTPLTNKDPALLDNQVFRDVKPGENTIEIDVK